MKQNSAVLLVNFGGPRKLAEIEPFLRALLTDRDVIRTRFPTLLHNYLFGRIAKKRAREITKDYDLIGGGSPIFADTEAVAEALYSHLHIPILTFHRYLPSTHDLALSAIEAMPLASISVFPLFPQFSFATTGSIARMFTKRLSKAALNKLHWVHSYPTHPAYIALLQRNIRAFLETKRLSEEEVILLFSAHGLPQKFVDTGDCYQDEVVASFQNVMEAFPKALGKLAYQSKFGPGEWIKPYTVDVCEQIRGWHEGREHVIFVPISFTSDHIETLFEVEKQYLPIVADQGLMAYRLPAFNRDAAWVEAITSILQDFTPFDTGALVRKTS